MRDDGAQLWWIAEAHGFCFVMWLICFRGGQRLSRESYLRWGALGGRGVRGRKKGWCT